MKTFAPIFVIAAMVISGSQADAQTLKGSIDGYETDYYTPNVQMARDAARNAFYASYDAWVAARAESGRSYYFYRSADLQYEALFNTYYALRMLESKNSFTAQELVSIELLADEAEDNAYNAAWYALAGAYDVGNPQHSAFHFAVNSWNKIELLVDELGGISPID